MGRRKALVAALCAALLLGGCSRSISDSGYPDTRGGRANGFYRGELTEFDVLGIEFDKAASDEDIARSAAAFRKVGTRKGASLLLIQSGAAIPDHPMVQALERYFTVIAFSGVPVAGREAAAAKPVPPGGAQTYASALRLAAAKGGADTIFCYWGVLESTVDREPTKAVSWVPIIGSAIPDETQHMRIRLKVAVIDVKTGSWSVFAPGAIYDASLSSALHRAGSDQAQVELLKEQGYKAAAEAFVAKYAG